MAEAIVKTRFPDWEAFSAGIRPTGVVHPLAIQVLQELGIEHRGISKSVEEFRNQALDLVVTVCDDANEECPIWPGQGLRKHVGFRDPAKAGGTEDERLEFFRNIRDEIALALPRILE
jgi:arsenate reductase